jgi:hypothetical protein
VRPSSPRRGPSTGSDHCSAKHKRAKPIVDLLELRRTAPGQVTALRTCSSSASSAASPGASGLADPGSEDR